MRVLCFPQTLLTLPHLNECMQHWVVVVFLSSLPEVPKAGEDKFLFPVWPGTWLSAGAFYSMAMLTFSKIWNTAVFCRCGVACKWPLSSMGSHFTNDVSKAGTLRFRGVMTELWLSGWFTLSITEDTETRYLSARGRMFFSAGSRKAEMYKSQKLNTSQISAGFGVVY